jgi:hypothetical protein
VSQPTNTASGGVAPANPSIDFVDFYQVLEVEQDATTTHLRRRINDLYSEAQSNRDHRNVSKRRRYEALCELLPYCRIVLLDPDKRVRYDRFLEQAHEHTPNLPDFETIMEEIAGSIGDGKNESTEKVGLLGVQNDDDFLPVADSARTGSGTAHTFAEKSATASNATTVAPKVDNSVRGGPAPRRRSRQPVKIDSMTGSALSVIAFSAVFIVTFLMHSRRFSVSVELVPALVVGLGVWIYTHARRTPVQ